MNIKRVLLIIILIAGLFFNQKSISSRQIDENIQLINKDLPPTLALTSIALGPLKGMIASALLWRAIDKEDKKEYFESFQLSRMITALQPTYAGVWTYQGFNLAFNIAATHKSKEERWPWILRGIELMRDEGLAYNPGNSEIRHDIMRTIKDKIDSTDTESAYFKNQWTILMLNYFKAGDLEELKILLQAETKLEILKQHPDVIALANIAKDNKIDLFDFVNHPPELHYNYISILLGGQLPTEKSRLQIESALRKIYFYHRRSIIEQDLKFDIQRCISIDTDYGPFDWRSHQATAIYWGIEKEFDRFKTGGINFTRMATGLLLSSFYEGKVIYNTSNDSFTRGSNMDGLAKIHRYYDDLLAFDPSARNHKSHRIFLENAITICYNSNQSEAARDLFEHYSENNYSGDKNLTYEQFILTGMMNTIKRGTAKESLAIVEAILKNSFNAARSQNYELSQGLRNRAFLVWKTHNKLYGKSSKALPSIREIEKSARENYAGGNTDRALDLENAIEKALKTKRPKIATE
jgi:hypothetical protein